MISNRSSFIVFCHDNYTKDAKTIWYLKYQIPSRQRVFGKVFKCPQINMYLVFYLNTSFEYLTQHCKVRYIAVQSAGLVSQCQGSYGAGMQRTWSSDSTVRHMQVPSPASYSYMYCKHSNTIRNFLIIMK